MMDAPMSRFGAVFSKRYGFFPVKPGPIAGTFYSALARLHDVNIFDSQDEETITAAFLGACISAFPFCVALFASGDDVVQRCAWGQYRKTGSASTQTESKSGADFVIVHWISKDETRVAIFQAKRVAQVEKASECESSGKNERPFTTNLPEKQFEMDVHRAPPKVSEESKERGETPRVKRAKRRPQLLQLISNGQRIYETISGENSGQDWSQTSSLKHLHWIHYLAYVNPTSIRLREQTLCVSLKDLEDESKEDRKNEVANTSKAIKVDLSGARVVALSRVFKEGFRRRCSSGWLTVHARDLPGLLPTLTEIGTVVVADQGDGRGLAELLEPDKVADIYNDGFEALPPSAGINRRGPRQRP